MSERYPNLISFSMRVGDRDRDTVTWDPIEMLGEENTRETRYGLYAQIIRCLNCHHVQGAINIAENNGNNGLSVVCKIAEEPTEPPTTRQFVAVGGDWGTISNPQKNQNRIRAIVRKEVKCPKPPQPLYEKPRRSRRSKSRK